MFMQKVQTIYQKALQYTVVDGFSVIPVGKDKRPLLSSWKEYQTRIATEEELQAWWQKYPTANIGIVTGKVSGITVIDIDVYKENHTEYTAFPETLTIKTGNGGYHLYYDYIEGLTISANAYPHLPGVDIRSDGGFVVAPPSITSYLKEGKKQGGEYTYENTKSLAKFPIHMFPQPKVKRTLSSTVGVKSGGRNDSIASVIGKLLQSEPNPDKFLSEVLPAVERINKTYSPPLPHKELLTTFESIMKKEVAHRASLIVSPMQVGGTEVEIRIRRSKSGVPYKDMANVLAVLESHPYYKGTIRYNEFKQDIEYNGKPFEEGDLVKIQYFMQLEMELHGIAKEAVYAAVVHYANLNKYDEAKDWLKSLEWDKVERLPTWITQATSVEDNEYHRGVGAQWIMGAIKRIMIPASTFDHVLVLVGGQGIGKTSFFRILGGAWYKSYTGAMDNKDFCLALRGAMIVDLDEGAALSKADSIKMKSIITETHDEFRAPYDRVMKKYPRRFVFSMSTNDTEPFKDITGNRRYWTVDVMNTINFEWLETYRDQIFAEAYHYFTNHIDTPQVPVAEALANQDAHLSDDAWTDKVCRFVRKSDSYMKGDREYKVTITEVYEEVFPGESLLRLNTAAQMRVANILKKELGLTKIRKSVDGERYTCWMLTKEKAKELEAKYNVLPPELRMKDIDIFDL